MEIKAPTGQHMVDVRFKEAGKFAAGPNMRVSVQGGELCSVRADYIARHGDRIEIAGDSEDEDERELERLQFLEDHGEEIEAARVRKEQEEADAEELLNLQAPPIQGEGSGEAGDNGVEAGDGE